MLSTHLTENAGAQDRLTSLLPRTDAAEDLLEFTETNAPQVDQTAPNANQFRQLQDTIRRE